MSNATNAMNPGKGSSPADMAFTKWIGESLNTANPEDQKLLDDDKSMMALRDAWVNGKSEDELMTLKKELWSKISKQPDQQSQLNH